MRRWLAMPLALAIFAGALPGLASTPPAFASDSPTSYMVAEGDSLSAIAVRFDVDPADLAQINSLTPGDMIFVGQKLALPAGAKTPAAGSAPVSVSALAAPQTYTVVEGDSLSAIAFRYGVDAGDLATLNGLTADDLLMLGQRVKLPPGAVLTRPAAPARPVVPDEYVVDAGDTLTSIASRFGVGVSALADTNALESPYQIFLGQRLKLPRSADSSAPKAPPTADRPADPPAATVASATTGGREYAVKAGDTPFRIALQFNVAVADLMTANGLKLDDVIYVGQKLKVPASASGTPKDPPQASGATPPASSAPAVTAPAASTAPPSSVTTTARPASDPFNGEEYVTVLPNESLTLVAQRARVLLTSLAAANGITDVNKIQSGQKLRVPHGTDFIQPVQGIITTFYGGSTPYQARHEAVDIACPVGTPIKAARDGKVTIADWAIPGSPGASYGLMVAIQHDDGYSTIYGHLSKLAVVQGQTLKKGDVIGFSGNTGLSTGPHVHWEMRKNGQNLDPLKYSQ